MSFDSNRIGVAEARTREARARLFATLNLVQDRLRPSHLASSAVESAAQGLAAVARKGAAAARRRPAAAAAVAGAIGLVMARRWIADILRAPKAHATGGEPKGLKAKRAKHSGNAKKGQRT